MAGLRKNKNGEKKIHLYPASSVPHSLFIRRILKNRYRAPSHRVCDRFFLLTPNRLTSGIVTERRFDDMYNNIIVPNDNNNTLGI